MSSEPLRVRETDVVGEVGRDERGKAMDTCHDDGWPRTPRTTQFPSLKPLNDETAETAKFRERKGEYEQLKINYCSLSFDLDGALLAEPLMTRRRRRTHARSSPLLHRPLPIRHGQRTRRWT